MSQNEPETRQVQVGDSHTESIPIIRVPEKDEKDQESPSEDPSFD